MLKHMAGCKAYNLGIDQPGSGGGGHVCIVRCVISSSIPQQKEENENVKAYGRV